VKSDRLKKIGQMILAGLAILWAAVKILSMILQYKEILREPDGLEIVLISVLITVVVFGIILAAAEKKRRKRLEDTKSTAYAGETAQAESTQKANYRFFNTGSIIKILIYVYVGVLLYAGGTGIVDQGEEIYVVAVMVIVTLIVLGLLRARKTKASREQSNTYIRTQSEQRKPGSPEDFELDEYDRRKRIEQLDGFLENGLIDREEYRRMKERYEKR